MLAEPDFVVWGYCGACYQELSPTDMRINAASNNQPQAVDDIDLSSLSTSCDDCKAELPWGSYACEHCGVIYPEIFWTTRLDEITGGDVEVISASSENQNSVVALADRFGLNPEQLMLCCNLPSERCDCITRIDWNNAFRIDPEYDQKAYEADARCESCAYMFTAECPEYREWAYETLLTDFPAIPIDGDGCGDWMDFNASPERLLAYHD